MGHKKIGVVGEGAWGTALAQQCARNKDEVDLWCHDAQRAEEINQSHTNKTYAGGVTLSSLISATTNLQDLVNACPIIIIAVPTPYIRSVLSKAQISSKKIIWVVASKGIEEQTHLLPHQIIEDIFPHAQTAIIAGPTFASGIHKQEVSALTLACTDAQIADTIKKIISSDTLQVEQSSDVIGVALAAALKNCYAIGNGIIMGRGGGTNTQAFFITRALQEMQHIITQLGGKPQTVLDLCGVGDMFLTALHTESKNVRAGIMLAQNKSDDEIKAAIGGIFPEGWNSILSFNELLEKRKIEAPILKKMKMSLLRQSIFLL
jgi:glycerol-3-phosphate dehydrogenase (NAD(P)+)